MNLSLIPNLLIFGVSENDALSYLSADFLVSMYILFV